MSSLLASLTKRQGCSNDPSTFNYCGTSDSSSNDGSDGYSWWWSAPGMAVRYAVVALLFLALVVLLVGGYWHAQRRVRAGLPPLAYHRWMVQRRGNQYQPNQFPLNQPYPPQSRYAHYGDVQGQSGYPPPPPAYNGWDAPPVYQPPEGASKVMADQDPRHVQRAGESSAGGPVLPPPAVHQ